MAAIQSSEIKFYLSGGAANSDPTLSHGGAISSVEVTPSTIFDTVTSVESAAGEDEYRLVYVKNTNGANSLTTPKVWIVTDANPGNITIALAGEGLNGSPAENPGDGYTAPTGESFTAPTSKGTGLAPADITAGSHYGIWIKRTIPASTAAASDTFTIRVEGDTLAA